MTPRAHLCACQDAHAGGLGLRTARGHNPYPDHAWSASRLHAEPIPPALLRCRSFPWNLASLTWKCEVPHWCRNSQGGDSRAVTRPAAPCAHVQGEIVACSVSAQ